MKNKFLQMLDELKAYKHEDKDSLMKSYIEERLDASFAVYKDELDHSLMFLKRKHEKSIIKRINRLK